ncbi:hypothetical protein ABZ471_08755 [Streptomyces sp. NPDC005728]|uniref:hypothetical protein n=1 Tax=Streptomyces sp. NPDC005728 TaxID=3157054 RepID=UPI0033D85412
MTGLEVAVGCVVAWVWRKARRVGDAADTEVDRALDAGMQRVHDLVTVKLEGDPALQRLRDEADAAARGADDEPAATPGPDSPAPGERTVRRLKDALADAMEDDAAFASELTRASEEYQRLQASLAPDSAPGAVHAQNSGVTAGGDITNTGGAIGRDFKGAVTVGVQAPREPGPNQH